MNSDALDTFQLEMGTASEVGMAIVLAVMMFAVALGLKPSNFSFFKTEPKLYLTGVAAQIIGLPLLTLLMCFVHSDILNFRGLYHADLNPVLERALSSDTRTTDGNQY